MDYNLITATVSINSSQPVIRMLWMVMEKVTPTRWRQAWPEVPSALGSALGWGTHEGGRVISLQPNHNQTVRLQRNTQCKKWGGMG